jgi:hypothetical protein
MELSNVDMTARSERVCPLKATSRSGMSQSCNHEANVFLARFSSDISR